MAKPKAPTKPGCLEYIGDGEHYIIGVPTSDLHDVESGEAERLIDSGLYAPKKSCDHEAVAAELAALKPPVEESAPADDAEPSESDQLEDDSGDNTGDDD
jgi:hypothetical protein